MKTLLITLGILGLFGALIVAIGGLARFFYWLSAGDLWGLALMLLVVSLPFVVFLAREIGRVWP